MRTDRVVRPLTPMERAMWMTDRAYPLSVVAALRTEPALSASALRRTLDAWQRRHPLLRTAIRDNNGPAFVVEAEPEPVPLEIATTDSGTPWLDACTVLLNARIPSDRAPLMRARLLRHPSGASSDLLLSFHHALVDGGVLVRLVRDLLTLCSADPEPPPFPTLTLSLTHPERLVPPLGARLRFLGRELRADRAYRRARRSCPPPPVRPDSACRADAFRLTREETQRLVRACRRVEVTVHAALLAALALEIRRRICPGAAVPLRVVSFADLRPRLDPADRDAAGAHVAMLRHTPTFPPDADLWTAARTCDALVTAAIRRGDAWAGAALAPLAMRQTLRSGRDRMGDVALSYPGPVDLPARFGDLTLSRVHAFISSNPLAPPLSGFAHLFDHRLHLALMTLSGDFDAAEARALTDGVRARVRV